MGGIEVRNDDRKAFRTRMRNRDKVVEVGPGGVIKVGIIDRSPDREKP